MSRHRQNADGLTLLEHQAKQMHERLEREVDKVIPGTVRLKEAKKLLLRRIPRKDKERAAAILEFYKFFDIFFCDAQGNNILAGGYHKTLATSYDGETSEHAA